MTRTIGIVSGKGGVGKTVVAINLAASLYKWYKKNVLLVDGNLSTSHVGLYLGLYSTPITLNDALKNRVPVRKAIYQHSSGIDVLPASLRVKDLQNIVPERIGRKIEPVFDDYDYVIVDGAPGFGREGLIAMDLCDETIFVTSPIVHSAADVAKCKKIAEKLDAKPIGLIVNMKRNKDYEINENDMRRLTELNVIGTIPFNDDIRKSIVSNKPVVCGDNFIVNSAFKKIARTVTGEEPVYNLGIMDKIQKAMETVLFTGKGYDNYKTLNVKYDIDDEMRREILERIRQKLKEEV